MACSKEILDFLEACEKQETFSNIYSKLPNNLIMNIIRTVDGGLNTHKQKFSAVINEIKKVRKSLEDNLSGVDYTGGELNTGHYVNQYKNIGFNLKSINMYDEDIDNYYNNYELWLYEMETNFEECKVLPFREYEWWSREDEGKVKTTLWDPSKDKWVCIGDVNINVLTW